MIRAVHLSHKHTTDGAWQSRERIQPRRSDRGIRHHFSIVRTLLVFLLICQFTLLYTSIPAQVAAAGGDVIATDRVSVAIPDNQAPRDSRESAISADGRFVVFTTVSPNMVPDDTNSTSDVFVQDDQTGLIERVSVDSAGSQAYGSSNYPAISADGRFVAFASNATNLVSGDTNGTNDVFVRDRQTGSTERISVGSAGTQANGSSNYPAISADGRLVAFISDAPNLVAGDTNNVADVFVYDRLAHATVRTSVDSAGNQATPSNIFPFIAISGDGRFVAFSSESPDLAPGGDPHNAIGRVFVHDLLTGSTERVSDASSGDLGDGASRNPSISADGRFIAFESSATNLVPGDTNGLDDIFVRDRQTGSTERVSVDSAGTQASNGDSWSPSISADGRFVTFTSWATNLAPGEIYLGFIDVFVHDRQTGVTQGVSVDSAGNLGNNDSQISAISADGRVIAFRSRASTLVPGDTNGEIVDVFARDMQAGITRRVNLGIPSNQANGNNVLGSSSADGRFVAFVSFATNLVAGDTNNREDVFVRDRLTAATERVNIDSAGNQANGKSYEVVISDDGRFVGFRSNATNLVAGDSNGHHDVFVRDRQTGTTERVSVSSAGDQADDDSQLLTISGDGRFVAFTSSASNLAPSDGGYTRFYVRDRQTGTTERVSVGVDGNLLGGGHADGDFFVVFGSYVYDWRMGTLEGIGGDRLSISSNGRFVTFRSRFNFVPGDTNGSSADIFVRDRQTGTTELVSVDSAGAQADGDGFQSAVSNDGRFVVFDSVATNLVADDTNGYGDVFVRDRLTGVTRRVSVDGAGSQGNGDSYVSTLSDDGRFVTYESLATNLVLGGTAGYVNIYVGDLQPDNVSQNAAAGDTITTDSENDGATPADPVETSITTPNPGTVSVLELTTSDPAPTGFSFFSQQVNITAPPATPANPLTFVFRIDAAAMPAGQDVNAIQVFRNGAFVMVCAGAPGTASPDPCISNRESLADGDAQLTVLTSAASHWNLGLRTETVPPIVTGTPDRPANADGWYNGNVTIDWTATDPAPSSGAPTDPPNTLATTEGANIVYTSSPSCDPAHNCATSSLAVSIDKTAPTIDPPAFSQNPTAVGNSTLLTVGAADSLSGLAGGEFFIGTDPGAGNASPLALSGSTLSASLGAALTPGVYPVGARSIDRAGNWSAVSTDLLVVYDPNSGFVTGSGWINSPLGAYTADPTLSGRANFGFVSKYQKGTAVPTGVTDFRFQVANLNFHAESYDWLVVAGARAQYKGTGTIDGTGNYGFLLTAVDGQVQGGGGSDKFRIKIWDSTTGAIVYDNQMSAADNAGPTATIAGGSIVIHK